MNPLENQIRNTFYKAMSDSLEKIVSTQMSADDIDWIVRLCEELKTRINSLTPKRTDLHNALNASMDTGLLKQMLEHAAFEQGDLKNIVNIIFERLEALCAPSQDQHVAQVKNTIMNATFEMGVSTLIMESNKIIDEIERLGREFGGTNP